MAAITVLAWAQQQPTKSLKPAVQSEPSINNSEPQDDLEKAETIWIGNGWSRPRSRGYNNNHGGYGGYARPHRPRPSYGYGYGHGHHVRPSHGYGYGHGHGRPEKWPGQNWILGR